MAALKQAFGVLLAVSLCLPCIFSEVVRADAYSPPACAPGGSWSYRYEGAAAAKGLNDNADGGTSLDGTWTWYCAGALKNMAVPPAHDDQCSWDGTGPGTHAAPVVPGGISVLTENAGATTFLRMQDAGDYSILPYSNPPIAAGNQKFLFGHNIAADVGGSAADTILDRGVTLSFRARLATTGPLDQQYPAAGGGPVAWPAGGDGYVDVFTIRQGMDQQAIRFGLALDSDLPGASYMNGRQGLVMNRFSTTSGNNRFRPNGVSAVTNSNGTLNVLQIADMTAWHEFWITIQKIGEPIVVDPATTPPTISKGVGTHQVTVWMDGSLTPAGTFVVNATVGASDFTFENYLQMGLSDASASGAVDVDFLAYALGAYPPGATTSLLVDPRVTQIADVAINEAHPGFTYTIRNNSATASTLVYTVTELDATQTPSDISWLSLTDAAGSPKSGGTVAVGDVDTLVARLNTGDPSLTSGTLSTAYLKFTDNNTPPHEILREVDLTVRTWDVGGALHKEYRVYTPFAPNSTIVPVTHTITNSTAAPMQFYVTTNRGYLTYPWTATPPNPLTVPAGGTVSVTGTFDKNGSGIPLFGDAGTVTVTFTNAADSADRLTRNINLRMMDAAHGTDVRVFTYRANVDPTTPNSAGAGKRFLPLKGGLGANLTGTVEQDLTSPSRRAWRIVDHDPDGRIVYRSEVTTESGAGRGLPTVRDAGVTVLACMKVNNWGGDRGPQLFLFHSDASGITGNNVLGSLTSWGHWGGLDGRLEEQLRGAVKIVPGSSDYAIIRLTAVGQYTDTDDTVSNLANLRRRHMRMYVNEDPTPAAVLDSGAVQYDWVDPSDGGGFGFGAGSTRGTMDVSFAWVSGTNAGAFAPGEEVYVIGRSLVPEFCHFPFADTDSDQDVDMDDFAVIQACFTGPDTLVAGNCACYDRPTVTDPEGDLHVDTDDLLEFIKCATGPDIPFDETVAAQAGCQP